MISFISNLFEINEDEGNIQNHLLVIENKALLYSICKDMQHFGKFKEYFKIYDETKQLDSEDYVEYITSLMHLDINCKRNLNLIYRRIKNEYNELIQKATDDIIEKFKDLFSSIKMDFSINIEEDIDYDQDDIVKSLGIHIFEDDESMLERITNYIKVTYELKKNKIFIIYGLHMFLSKEELSLLLKECNYVGVNIISVEGIMPKETVFNQIKIIDKDLCLID